MFCFCKNAEFPEFIIKLFHICCNSGLNYSEIMVIHFLTLGRLCSEKSSSCKTKIPSLFIHFLINKEIFLLGSYRSAYTFYSVIAEKAENAECLLIECFH